MKYVRIITKIIQEMNGGIDIQLGFSKIIAGRDQDLIEEIIQEMNGGSDIQRGFSKIVAGRDQDLNEEIKVRVKVFSLSIITTLVKAV